MINTGVIGAGYWGTNIIRVANDVTSLRYICDLDYELLVKKYGALSKHSLVQLTEEYNDILGDTGIEAVFIATPPETHYKIAKDCINAGKHVFIEKPMTSSSQEADDLMRLAEKKQVKLAVGHTFLYSSPVIKVKEIIESGELGDIIHIEMNRKNLGKFQEHCDVIYDLAPHDFSMLLYWIPGFDIKDATIALFNHYKGLQPDTAYVNMVSNKGQSISLAYSWIYPYKIRKTIIVGTKKCLVYDDTDPNNSIVIYDKGIDKQSPSGLGEFICSYRTGDCYLPYIKMQEPLKQEITAFCDAVEFGESLPNDGENGKEVVRLIEKIREYSPLES